MLDSSLVAIQGYLSALTEEGATNLYEAKLLVVGEGEVGKTCLAYKIADPSFDVEHRARDPFG